MLETQVGQAPRNSHGVDVRAVSEVQPADQARMRRIGDLQDAELGAGARIGVMREVYQAPFDGHGPRRGAELHAAPRGWGEGIGEINREELRTLSDVEGDVGHWPWDDDGVGDGADPHIKAADRRERDGV